MKKYGWLGLAIILGSGVAVAGGDILPQEPVVSAPVITEKNRDESYYVGLGLVYNRIYSIDSGWWNDNPLTQDETGGLTGIIGYNYNEYIGVEGRFSKSMWERDYGDITTWSIFLKPQYRFWERDKNSDNYDDGYFTVYGLIGFGNSNVEGTKGDNSRTSAWPEAIGNDILDETGFQWGIGVSYTFVEIEEGNRKNTWSIFLDYTSTAKDADINSRLYRYLDTENDDSRVYDELSTDGLTIGVTYTF